MGVVYKNRLLEALRAQTGVDFATQCVAVTLPQSTVLNEACQRPRYVHFMTSGIASVVTTMHSGYGVEVGMSGYEGFPEAVYLLGPETGTKGCMMQVSGTALRMEFNRFEEEFCKNNALHRLVLRLAQYESLVTSQLAACNGLHEVEERLARWLLMVEDRIGTPELPLTQEFLGNMLGTRRSTVTITAGHLQRSGIIGYNRGLIRVERRDRLEEVACECYEPINRMLENLYR